MSFNEDGWSAQTRATSRLKTRPRFAGQSVALSRDQFLMGEKVAVLLLLPLIAHVTHPTPREVQDTFSAHHHVILRSLPCLLVIRAPFGTGGVEKSPRNPMLAHGIGIKTHLVA